MLNAADNVQALANVGSAALRAQAAICNKPHDNGTKWVRVVAWVSGILPFLAVTMRFASRHLGGNEFWWDDWIHLASAVSDTQPGPSISAYHFTRF